MVMKKQITDQTSRAALLSLGNSQMLEETVRGGEE